MSTGEKVDRPTKPGKTRMKEMLEVRGLKQSWVARRLGLKTSTLSGYVSGRNPPPREVLDAMAELLQCRVEELENGVAKGRKHVARMTEVDTAVLVERMAAKDLTVQELADLLEVSKQTVYLWRKNQSSPEGVHLENLCRVLGVSAAEIVRPIKLTPARVVAAGGEPPAAKSRSPRKAGR